MKKLVFSVCLAAMLSLSACGDSSDEDEKEIVSKPAETLYMDGRNLFSEGKYKEAVEQFDEVERQHPYSQWAPRAQIMAAYAQYRGQLYDDAVLTLERFVKLHPSHESAPYAYYLMALCYYEQISDVGRDQGLTQKAQKSLRDVVRRFPGSDYARDAQLKLDLTEDHLAGKEMMVGRYYLDREEYLSAANRFRFVVENYQTTSHVPEALHRLVETYLELGVPDEAKRYAAVLGHNFPGSEWYRHSYELLEGKAPVKEDDSFLGVF